MSEESPPRRGFVSMESLRIEGKMLRLAVHVFTLIPAR